METITHICDICKQSKSKEELARLEVRSSGLEFFDRYSNLKIDVCKACLEKKNFIVNEREDKSLKDIQTQNQYNLEDRIIEILSDLGVQFYE